MNNTISLTARQAFVDGTLSVLTFYPRMKFICLKTSCTIYKILFKLNYFFFNSLVGI